MKKLLLFLALAGGAGYVVWRVLTEQAHNAAADRDARAKELEDDLAKRGVQPGGH